jgi:SAM-dependent methyltransferase
MGEIFERPLPAVSLPFTGERLTTEFGGQTEIEHLHRYILARHLCRDRQVLDIASGEGYGAALLAQVASSVVGVEIAADVVAHAAANYRRDNLSFRVGDALDIPLEDAAVDVVVSFETLEHLAGHDRFLSEIRRVLRPGGLLVISTPDRDNYSPADRPPNPFHALELTRSEFTALLHRHFGHLAIWWQRPMIGSAMLPGPDTAVAPGALCFERRGDRHFEASSGYPRPLYLLALCSEVRLPELPPSVYIDTTSVHLRDDRLQALQVAEQQVSALREALLGRDASLASERAELGRLQQELSALREELLGRQQELSALREELLCRDNSLSTERAELERLQQELSELRASASCFEQDLATLRHSTSWRITGPVRAAVNLLRGRCDANGER